MKTPFGFLTRYNDYCLCDIEAEKLLCLAARTERDLGRPTRSILLPHDSTTTITFSVWLRQLALDLRNGSPVVAVRAIMEEWPRKRILRALRHRGETYL